MTTSADAKLTDDSDATVDSMTIEAVEAKEQTFRFSDFSIPSCCPTCSGAFFGYLIGLVFVAKNIADHVLNLLLIQTFSTNLIGSISNLSSIQYAYIAFTGLDLLFLLFWTVRGLAAVCSGSVARVFFSNFATALVSLNFGYYKFLDSLTDQCSLLERIGFWDFRSTKPDELLYFFIVKIPQAIILLIFVGQNFVQGFNSNSAITDIKEILDVPLKIVLLLISAAAVLLAVLMWPCIRFVVAYKQRSVHEWCHKRIYKRLTNLHQRMPSHRRSQSAPEMSSAV